MGLDDNIVQKCCSVFLNKDNELRKDCNIKNDSDGVYNFFVFLEHVFSEVLDANNDRSVCLIRIITLNYCFDDNKFKLNFDVHIDDNINAMGMDISDLSLNKDSGNYLFDTNKFKPYHLRNMPIVLEHVEMKAMSLIATLNNVFKSYSVEMAKYVPLKDKDLSVKKVALFSLYNMGVNKKSDFITDLGAIKTLENKELLTKVRKSLISTVEKIVLLGDVCENTLKKGFKL